jgi:hypothetical protein
LTIPKNGTYSTEGTNSAASDVNGTNGTLKLHPAEYESMSLLPIEVRDGDRVLSSLPMTGDGMTTPAEESNVAYITPHSGFGDLPEMPNVKISIPGAPQSLQASWRLTVEYKRPNGAQLPEDKVGLPSFQSDDYMVPIPASQAWEMRNDPLCNLEIERKGFFGGVAKLYLKLGETSVGEVFRFRIGGKKPEVGPAKIAIGAAASAVDSRLIGLSYAVGRRESKDYNGEGSRYNQFWEGNGRRFQANHCRGDPLWCKSPDEDSAGGFGIFQITGDTNSKFSDVPRKVMWDWRENLNAYLVIVSSKGAWFEGTFLPFVESNEGSSYRAPPVTAVYDNRTLTSWEMAAITLYNGAGGCPVQGYGRDDSDPTGYKRWKRCPWHFDNPGWSYHENLDKPRGYLHNVILEANQ